jgi:hypothetical protein
MLKSKSQMTCSYCSKIFKKPILLPCHDSICLEHLSEKAVVKANRIKCNKCNEEFGVKDNKFKPNEALNKLIESHSHLSNDEISLKQKLRASIRNFFDFYDEFNQNKSKLDLDVFNHFQEMRFRIDEHREELKKKIDEIALEMINETTKCQNIYLNNLKENLFETSSFYEVISIEDTFNEMEEVFRNPNLLIETIKTMQQKQEKSLKCIQLKLNEINQVKDHLEEANEFQPKSSLDQTETSLFGSLSLNGYSKINSFGSEILTDLEQCLDLIDLCEFSPNDKWSLLYRGTRDGFGASDFHSKCDGHSNTLTLLKAKESSYIFGGYTTVNWESCPNPGKYKSDPNAFIFSLTNKDKTPLKMKVNPNSHEYAIYFHSEMGPAFSLSINIANDSNTRMNSFSNLGYIYKHPQYKFLTDEAQTYLAGSYHFQLDEIEVYQLKFPY